MTHPLLPVLRRARVVPVVRTSTAALAATACAWLREAGMTVLEITLTMPDALALIRELSGEPGLLVGAGTVPDERGGRGLPRRRGEIPGRPPGSMPAWPPPPRAAGACAMLGAMTPTEIRAASPPGPMW